jgi:hypothetical protein
MFVENDLSTFLPTFQKPFITWSLSVMYAPENRQCVAFAEKCVASAFTVGKHFLIFPLIY